MRFKPLFRLYLDHWNKWIFYPLSLSLSRSLSHNHKKNEVRASALLLIVDCHSSVRAFRLAPSSLCKMPPSSRTHSALVLAIVTITTTKTDGNDVAAELDLQCCCCCYCSCGENDYDEVVGDGGGSWFPSVSERTDHTIYIAGKHVSLVYSCRFYSVRDGRSFTNRNLTKQNQSTLWHLGPELDYTNVPTVPATNLDNPSKFAYPQILWIYPFKFTKKYF